ncbi:hypothetical protein QYZ88_001410 [Lachnospiraceae bacterium C1.1]|nr:hypothetical protein [Lachnospiraceae bacterium C1.1]
MNDVYISIMIESLQKKSVLLDELYMIDEEQTRLLNSDTPDRQIVERNLSESCKLANKIEGLDDGFETVYKKVRGELLNNSRAHKDQIVLLKELISEVTEKSVKIMAAECRNQETASEKFVFSTKKAQSTRYDSRDISGKYKKSMTRSF